ncbi:MAG: cation transporter [Chloroflexi bacterium]|nr:cation transporter [Chloroflexota bacterium]
MEERDSHLGNKLRTALFITVAILVAEVVGGYLANSIALLSDAGHMATDIFALLLAWFAVVTAQKAPNERMTYGYHRVGILIAIANAMLLVGLAIAIFYEAAKRLQEPPSVKSGLMLAVASVGLVANAIVIYMLHSDQQHNLSIRSAFFHVAGDLLGSLGVLVGGTIIIFTRWYWIDPLISILIGGLMIVSSQSIFREGIHIVLDATPRDVNTEELVKAIMEITGVREVHDLHVWSIAPHMRALSCHVLIGDVHLSQSARTLERINSLLATRFNIHHTTVQMEYSGQEPACPDCLFARVNRRVIGST